MKLIRGSIKISQMNPTIEPSADQRPPMVLSMRGEFHDFDALAAAARAWGLDWVQLDRGPLQTVRLQSVRRNLLGKSPGNSISEIAASWGFWHMGQFAAVYRRQFGELPSETVPKARTA